MLRRMGRRNVAIKPPLPGYGGNAFEAQGRMVQANVQPMNGTATAQMYGLQPSQMRLMLCDKAQAPKLGDGVCVDVAATDDPDFRVVYTAEWTRHALIHLRYIPEHERGADE